MSDPAKALLRWLGARDPVAQLVLACADLPVPQVARGTVVVQVECLADTDVGLPAQLLANGVGTVLTLPCDRACEAVATWVEMLAGVLPFRPPRRGRRTKDVLTLGQVPLPRRVLLGLPTESVLDLSLDDAARTLVAFQMLQETGRARLPGAGARPPDAPGTTTSPVTVDAAPNHPAGPPSSAAALSVSGCIACGVCVRACPHDALVLEHADGTSTLTHLAESCRSEMQCVALCPVGAFDAPGPLPLAAVLEEPQRLLATVATAPCGRCGARHPAADGALCPACRFREGNAFGAALPPGVADRLPPDVAAKLSAGGGGGAGERSDGGERD